MGKFKNSLYSKKYNTPYFTITLQKFQNLILNIRTAVSVFLMVAWFILAVVH